MHAKIFYQLYIVINIIIDIQEISIQMGVLCEYCLKDNDLQISPANITLSDSNIPPNDGRFTKMLQTCFYK